MNATEMGRRSDSLYYDNVSRRELCDRIAHLESDLDAAKNDLSIFSGELVKSKAENIKLRKLVQRMWPAFIGEKRATFADRLHVRAEIDELGIEVG